MIEEIEIRQQLIGLGFVNPPEIIMRGVIFENGKIAYLDMEEDICTEYDEKSLIRSLMEQVGCISVRIVRHYRK